MTMQGMGIISPVVTSDFATPVVPVVKRDGSARLCGDYMVTLKFKPSTGASTLPVDKDL